MNPAASVPADADLPLALRRERLLQRSAALRQQLLHDASVLEAPLARADRLLAALGWLRQHPQWPLGALLLTLLWRPRRVVTLGRWVWRVWRWRQRAVRLLQAWSGPKSAAG